MRILILLIVITSFSCTPKEVNNVELCECDTYTTLYWFHAPSKPLAPASYSGKVLTDCFSGYTNSVDSIPNRNQGSFENQGYIKVYRKIEYSCTKIN